MRRGRFVFTVRHGGEYGWDIRQSGLAKHRRQHATATGKLTAVFYINPNLTQST